MKYLFLLLLSGNSYGQLTLMKITPKELITNLDSVFLARFPLSHADSLQLKTLPTTVKIKLYNVMIADPTGKIIASKQPGKQWTGPTNKLLATTAIAPLNALISAILYYDTHQAWYRKEELYENRFIDHLEVYRKSDSTKLATFTYTPLKYLIPKP